MTLADVLDHLIESDMDRAFLADCIVNASKDADAHDEQTGVETSFAQILLAAFLDLNGAFKVEPHHDSVTD